MEHIGKLWHGKHNRLEWNNHQTGEHTVEPVRKSVISPYNIPRCHGYAKQNYQNQRDGDETEHPKVPGKPVLAILCYEPVEPDWQCMVLLWLRRLYDDRMAVWRYLALLVLPRCRRFHVKWMATHQRNVVLSEFCFRRNERRNGGPYLHWRPLCKCRGRLDPIVLSVANVLHTMGLSQQEKDIQDIAFSFSLRSNILYKNFLMRQPHLPLFSEAVYVAGRRDSCLPCQF